MPTHPGLDRSGTGAGSTNVKYPTSPGPNPFDAIAQYFGGLDQINNQQQQSQFGQLTDAFGGALSSLGGLLSSLLGGGGGRGKGGASAKDIGEQLGLKRDEINAQRGYLQQQAMFGQADINLQNQMLALQTQQQQQQFGEQQYEFKGGQAARGALTTAGTQHQENYLTQQFQDVMKRLGINKQYTGLYQQENDAKFAYGFKRNDFAQQNLDLSAGQAGFQSPFAIPNPTPVQQKKK